MVNGESIALNSFTKSCSFAAANLAGSTLRKIKGRLRFCRSSENEKMKRFHYLLACLLCISCVSSKNNTEKSLKGNWELSVFPTTDKTFAEVFGQRRPTISFDLAKSTIGGNTGCNHFSGSYTMSDHSLIFSPGFISTKMACPGYEETIFLDAFNKVNRYTISNSELQLLHDSTLIMGFVRK
jgi:heat shock protein HslJ